MYEIRAHGWNCRQKWGTENAHVIFLLLFPSVSSGFKPRTEIPMKGLGLSPTSAGIASSAHPMTTYILTNHPRHLHVILLHKHLHIKTDALSIILFQQLYL
jgi:hypothetical protein